MGDIQNSVNKALNIGALIAGKDADTKVKLKENEVDISKAKTSLAEAKDAKSGWNKIAGTDVATGKKTNIYEKDGQIIQRHDMKKLQTAWRQQKMNLEALKMQREILSRSLIFGRNK